MKFTYVEKLILTKEEVEILEKARLLIDDIFADSKMGGKIESLAKETVLNISILLSKEFSEMER